MAGIPWNRPAQCEFPVHPVASVGSPAPPRSPQDLELPATSEETILSQREVFSAAGFDVAEDPEAPPGRRLRLVAAPAVQGVVCGRSDLEELIWLVQESPGPLTALR